jgi:hypothetical protein
MLNPDFLKTVSFNCDVSDANYWGYFSICTLLLRLRELFKIERGLEPWDRISNDEILPWIERKEAVWKKLENASLIPVQINGKFYSPFDIEEINSIIVNNGFVYGAGFALFMKPSFFIGLIHRFEKVEGYDVYFIEKEIVRDIFSSPGMSVGHTVFIRLTDIKYRLWENLQSWRGKNSHEFLLKSGILHEYQISSKEFQKIIDTYSKIVLYHEIAEQELNSSCWNEMIKKCDNSKTEHILRGILDFVADFSEKGPVYKAFLERNKELLSLYILTQGAYQKKILNNVFLQIQQALISEDWQKIEEIRNIEFNRWKNNHKQILEIFKLQGFDGVKTLTDKIFEGGIN